MTHHDPIAELASGQDVMVWQGQLTWSTKGRASGDTDRDLGLLSMGGLPVSQCRGVTGRSLFNDAVEGEPGLRCAGDFSLPTIVCSSRPQLMSTFGCREALAQSIAVRNAMGQAVSCTPKLQVLTGDVPGGIERQPTIRKSDALWILTIAHLLCSFV